MIPTVRVAGPPTALLATSSLAAVLTDVGPDFLRAHRWYAAKARQLARVSLVDALPVTAEPVLAIVLVRCDFAHGPAETYQLLLGMKPAIGDAPPPDVLASIQGNGETVWLYEAATEPLAALSLLSLLPSPRPPTGQSGHLASIPAPEPPPRRFATTDIRPIGAEQSNTSIVFGREVVLKLYRKLEPGLSPDLELNHFLSEAGFAHVPRFRGALEYVGTGEPIALALVQDYVPNHGDGWADALQSVQDYLGKPSRETLQGYEARIRQLGHITGGLHRALAAAPKSTPMAAEPVSATDVHAWQQGWQARWRQLVPLLQARGYDAESLQRALAGAAARYEAIGDAGSKIRHHGDYHLGQVLRLDHDWLILDFEGEPARSLAERQAKQSPLRDVAGMMRSFGYAAHVGLAARARQDEEARQRLSALADTWEEAARQAFWQGYLDAMHDSCLLPPTGSDRKRLLELFELDKAIYELGYELNNRPDWVDIPLAGIWQLVKP